MSLKSAINNHFRIKKMIHWMLIPSGKARPRFWVRLFINPFFHQKGSGAHIRWHTRMDVFPFNKFVLGSDSTIEEYCTINNGVGDVIIGNNTLIGIGNTIIGPITIGNNVIFAQNIVASALNHEYKNPHIPIRQQAINTAKIIIEDDCWIAANVVITAGVTIGKHSVVAAGAVVTKNIPPYTVVVGTPAKIFKVFNADSGIWERIS
jgi:acetyltransferase-like isoleucine patch superfamily enzyme